MNTRNVRQEVGIRSQKLIGLELLRFLSALAVLIWHYQHFFYIANRPSNFIRTEQPFYGLLKPFYDYGFLGVKIFWCISGFIFFWKYRDAIAEKVVSLKRFFALRFSRLYPLHIVTLLIVAALQATYFSQNYYYFVYQDNDTRHFFLQLFLASNWGFERGASFNGPIWSISVEVLIYFFFFFALRYAGKSIFVSILILLLSLTALLGFHLDSAIFECLAFFYIGGLSAVAFLHFESKNYRKILNILALILIILMMTFAYLVGDLFRYREYTLIFMMTYLPLLLFYGAQGCAIPIWARDIIEAAGNMTYSSYLIHFPIQLVLALCFMWMEQSIPYYHWGFFVGYLLSTLVASFYIYRLFELPAQRIIREKLKV